MSAPLMGVCGEALEGRFLLLEEDLDEPTRVNVSPWTA
jgi:hypothetical protein